uniref:Extracellular leucine-rich repeat and fibronectin type III domain containing 2a n=1 Tax=Neogobius melanostomus TaxID=47308 RepID=A0A8C6TIB2_9GOBI
MSARIAICSSVLLWSLLVFAALFVSLAPLMVSADCWLIEGDKGYVWLAICSQNQPPFETIPPHINSTVHDLRLNDNKLKVVLFTSMYRFTNLTDLNLTKNDISYIEDGAFANQANLQILQLGYNKLTNLTEGMLRGLGRLQCLYLQHNLLEIISTNTFWECPSLSSLDLSSNKLARLDPTTFAVLNRLTVCELAANPFHCGCDLFSFLSWLEEFNNVTHTYDRLQCETPREMFGYPLLSPVPGHGKNARTILSTRCRDGVIIPGMPSQLPDLDGSGLGLDNTDQGFYHQPNTSSTADALNKNQITMVTQAVSQYSASLRVQIPEPFSKMYILSQYNHTLVADKPLKKTSEVIMLDKLQPHTNYTYCVASVSKSQRYNHTCLSFTTRADGPEDHRANPSTTTHYIMTIVGCLFGMLLVLGFVYYCLRRRRAQEEKEKAISVKKTILEMRTGPPPQLTGPRTGPPPQLPDQGPDLHLSYRKRTGPPPQLPDKDRTSTSATGPWTGPPPHAEEEDDDANDPEEDVHGSNSEISTIAKEVDKVNQIINNCIDALKLDASSPTHLPPHPHPSMAPVPLVMPLSERPGISGGGFLTPPYRDPPPRGDPPKYQEKTSPLACKKGERRCSSNGINGGGVSVNGASTGCSNGSGSSGGPKAVQTAQHLEVQPDYHSSEHRHSFPALYYDNPDDSPNSKYLKPQRSRRDAPAGYAQLSPARHHNYNSGYSSSPEYSSSSESTLRIWERFKPYRKSPREEAAAYIAAGHALRKKVQFAKDEDLHDILDYWKGVSAQQKL